MDIEYTSLVFEEKKRKKFFSEKKHNPELIFGFWDEYNILASFKIYWDVRMNGRLHNVFRPWNILLKWVNLRWFWHLLKENITIELRQFCKGRI